MFKRNPLPSNISRRCPCAWGESLAACQSQVLAVQAAMGPLSTAPLPKQPADASTGGFCHNPTDAGGCSSITLDVAPPSLALQAVDGFSMCPQRQAGLLDKKQLAPFSFRAGDWLLLLQYFPALLLFCVKSALLERGALGFTGTPALFFFFRLVFSSGVAMNAYCA